MVRAEQGTTMTQPAPERAALDAQYNLRAAVPEHLTYFARYERDSAALRARRPGRLDLAYGATPRQAIDLFLPRGAGPAPLLAFIHGGYWQSRDRKDFSFVAGPLLERRAAVALLGYDLAPEVRMDTIVAQVRAGLAWLYRHAPAHGCDPARLHVAGHSAGGHLAAMALATDWRTFALPVDMIKGVCAISGIFDLEPIRRCYLNDVVGLDDGEARRNSPLHQALHGRCPVIVAVGERETEAFHEQSRAFAARLERDGWPCRLLVQPGVDHFGIVMSMAAADAPLVRAITEQLGAGGTPA
jgi:arylformamidase